MRAAFGIDEKVVFTDHDHSYTKDGERYISVTTLISKYHEKFKSDYWSTYKAVKDELESCGGRVWSDYKKKAGGWENVVDYYRINLDLGLLINANIESRKQEYLREWEYEKDVACALGNRAHDGLEADLLNVQQMQSEENETLEIYYADIQDLGREQAAIVKAQRETRSSEIIRSAHPELLMWNEEYKLAGQADLVERIGHIVNIDDYKTCKKITMEPFMDAKFFAPLDELPDANYFKFTMQFSTYGWILEQQGFEVGRLRLIHINRDTQEHIRNYIIAYRDDLVIKMLKNYASISAA